MTPDPRDTRLPDSFGIYFPTISLSRSLFLGDGEIRVYADRKRYRGFPTACSIIPR